MERTNLKSKPRRRNRATTLTREGNGGADATPLFHCPSCGTAVAGSVEVARKHEQFLKRLFNRQEELQRSLASSIHDDLAQQLAGALLYFEGAQPSQGRSVGEAEDHFRIGLKLLRDGIHEARRIAGRLQPLICDDEEIELELGLEYLIHEMRSRDGPEIVFRIEGEVGRLAPELESAAFRIARELLANACCHSQSREVFLKVARCQDRLRLEVEDRGIGFDPNKVDGKAFGLQEVQQRARLLGGNVVIDSTPGQGTRVVVCFPL